MDIRISTEIARAVDVDGPKPSLATRVKTAPTKVDARDAENVKILKECLKKLEQLADRLLLLKSRLQALAAQLVELRPDLVVAQSSYALAALRQATRTLSIVFAYVTDPVGQGFVQNLARPGGNVTGFAMFEFSMGGKWLDLLKK